MSLFAVPAASLYKRAERPVLPTISSAPAMRCRADRGLELATGVKTWYDMSVNGRHPTNATGANQPTLIASAVNGLPALRFNGTSQFLQVAFTLAQPFTLFLVYKSIVIGAGTVHDIIVDGNTSVSTIYYADNSPLTQLYAGTTGCQYVGNVANGSYTYVSATYNGASSILRARGTQIASGNVGAGSAGGITLGSAAGGTRWANCEIAEVIVHAAAVSAADVLLYEAYFASRYGL